MSEKKIEIYYDGSCPMCNAFVDTVDESAHAEMFQRQDVTKGRLPAGATFEQVWNEMYVVESDGKTYVGGDAVLRVMDEYWYWKPFVWIGRIPGINYLVRMTYRFVARNRHRIPWRKKRIA